MRPLFCIKEDERAKLRPLAVAILTFLKELAGKGESFLELPDQSLVKLCVHMLTTGELPKSDV